MKSFCAKKRFLVYLVCATLVFSFLFSTQQSVYANAFADENSDISFQFPESETIIPVLNNANYKSFTDTDSSSVTIIISDIYYEVTDNGEKDLIEKYPQDSVWIGCGLFADTWDNQDYVYNYLLTAINKSSVQYTATIERITIQGLPYYRFSYYEESGNPEKPGGIIYLTLYRAKLYTIYFSNFYRYSVSANYGVAFENSVQVNGIEEYEFQVFQDHTYIFLIAAGAAVLLVLTAAVLIIRRNRKRI